MIVPGQHDLRIEELEKVAPPPFIECPCECQQRTANTLCCSNLVEIFEKRGQGTVCSIGTGSSSSQEHNLEHQNRALGSRVHGACAQIHAASKMTRTQVRWWRSLQRRKQRRGRGTSVGPELPPAPRHGGLLGGQNKT